MGTTLLWLNNVGFVWGKWAWEDDDDLLASCCCCCDW